MLRETQRQQSSHKQRFLIRECSYHEGFTRKNSSRPSEILLFIQSYPVLTMVPTITKLYLSHDIFPLAHSGITTADPPSPSHPIICLLYFYTFSLHAFFHDVNTSSLFFLLPFLDFPKELPRDGLSSIHPSISGDGLPLFLLPDIFIPHIQRV